MAFATGPIPIQGLTRPDDMRNPSVVALGGGHGLSASLSALRRLTTELTAVVTVADDGGSSGRLRGSFDVLPPGDLRMALAALCDDNDWGRTWRDVMQHRFQSDEHPEEPLNGHAVGNLLILALWELLDSPVAGLRWAGALLGARGQVLPMSTVPLSIHGEVLEADEVTDTLIKRRIDGQAQLAAAGGGGLVSKVYLEPDGAPACPEALDAIELADWIILGPGSWYTSVLPHLLLPDMRQAIADTTAKKLLTMNLSVDTAETSGMDAAAHLEVLGRYAPNVQFDAIIADESRVRNKERFELAAQKLGARVFFSRVGVSDGRAEHDPLRLAAAYHEVFTAIGS
ncbi:2-phospho-L-lactate transferase [Arthrobacter sp. MYb211]|uniref:gluconeogenesis factor YvcK family protein n=1 Tax=Micrococcaceae TaxID=1268 RepID=UPI000CFD4C6E|nr:MULTISPECIES: uridine diphosphate-N-acetylglucosamine-binding protein YvcK [unclassified Arthrobacter]PRA01340.1 2-phospho-L-lactate transferase [Arthrobacter sp. MYb224]PRA06468.1 2-phospho-L-lactate transferase [Arthrobacter sp. MYb229]PRA12601.1 2-phospho-L-lactate transferase [Arthrobacter sp. MYb221]PRB53370.1 2-phospho-L-lactate transferase [Arthrobacter sp. MYb216]PRC09880.1 2-phospho-L-lactate transferase [Arthrobacter sp. MYb211]